MKKVEKTPWFCSKFEIESVTLQPFIPRSEICCPLPCA
jgi:hypothetical protein